MHAGEKAAPPIQARLLEGRADILLSFDSILNMSANEAGRERNDAFVYHGREGEDVPQDVIHVRVHPSVKVIRARAFVWRCRLISVELHDGLEVIEKEAFRDCRSLREILFPPSVRAIKNWAFSGCLNLKTVILNDGLEEIERKAFGCCRS